MKYQGRNFSLILAALTFSLSTVAGITSAKRITACFSQVVLQDFSGNPVNLRTPFYNITSCNTVRWWQLSGIRYLRSVTTSSMKEECGEDGVNFCCIEFEEISNPGAYPNVSYVNIDGVPKKYEIVSYLNIYCYTD